MNVKKIEEENMQVSMNLNKMKTRIIIMTILYYIYLMSHIFLFNKNNFGNNTE